MDEQEVGWLHYVGSHYTQYVNMNIQQHEGCLFTLLDLEVGGCSLWLMWGLQTHVSLKKNKFRLQNQKQGTLKNVIYEHPHTKKIPQKQNKEQKQSRGVVLSDKWKHLRVCIMLTTYLLCIQSLTECKEMG